MDHITNWTAAAFIALEATTRSGSNDEDEFEEEGEDAISRLDRKTKTKTVGMKDYDEDQTEVTLWIGEASDLWLFEIHA